MVIIIIILIACILRVIALDQSLWLDEAISVLAARDYNYSGIIFDFLKIDNHPPLFYSLLRSWGQIFGFVDLNLRLLSVLAGTILVFFVYKVSFNIGRNIRTAQFAGILAAVSPLLVYYSQEVRMYIFITLFCTIHIFLFQSISKKDSIWKWLVFSLMSCVLFFTDYITVFFLPVLILYPILIWDLKLLKKVLLSFIPLFMLLIFWYPYLLEQLVNNKELVSIFPGWQSIIGGATFKNLSVFWMKLILGRISFEPKLFYYGLIGFFSIPVLTSLLIDLKYFRKNLLIWIWLIFPIFSGFLFSFFIPVFNYFRFIFVLPALLILCACSISKQKVKFQYLILGLILVGNIIGLAIYYFDPSQQRENWRQAVDFIEKESREKDMVVFEFYQPPAPYRFYSTGKIYSIGATDSYFADQKKTMEKLGKNLEGKSGVYHFEYLRDLSDPDRFVEQKLKNEGFSQGKIYNEFYNIGQIAYWSR